METRNDLARPRASFKVWQDRSLPIRQCGQCREDEYRTDSGLWLHWRNLEARCGESTPIGASKPRQGAKLGAVGLDTPARGLARARCDASYRRPSWEWMGCR